MTRHLTEKFSGVGDIYSGESLLRKAVAYELECWSDEGRQGGDNAPSVGIRGTVAIGGIGEVTVLSGPDNLILKLEDGRRLSSEMTGTGGEIVGRGALQPA